MGSQIRWVKILVGGKSASGCILPSKCHSLQTYFAIRYMRVINDKYLFADPPFISKYHICISRITKMHSKPLSRGLGGCTEPTTSCTPHLIFADLLFHSFEEKKQLSMGGPDGIISGLILADFTFVNLTDQRQA